jgi:hypothetical protein
MAFTVIYDANAMYGNTPRDLLIRIARAGLVQAKWTEEILDEVLGALARNRQVIVTANIKHFPAELLTPWNVEAKSPDEFVLDQISIDDRTVFACVQAIVDSRDQRPETVDDVLGQLERAGLVESAAALRTN